MEPQHETRGSNPDESSQSQRCCAAEQALTEAELAADVRTLEAVSNATRYEALRLIADADEEGICVCELEPALGVSQGAVSQALSRLYAAELVTRRKQGRWRYYAATPRADRLLETLDEIRSNDDE